MSHTIKGQKVIEGGKGGKMGGFDGMIPERSKSVGAAKKAKDLQGGVATQETKG